MSAAIRVGPPGLLSTSSRPPSRRTRSLLQIGRLLAEQVRERRPEDGRRLERARDAAELTVERDESRLEIVDTSLEDRRVAVAAERAAQLLPEQAELGAQREDLLHGPVVEIEPEPREPSFRGLEQGAITLAPALQETGALDRRRQSCGEIGGQHKAHPVVSCGPDDE